MIRETIAAGLFALTLSIVEPSFASTTIVILQPEPADTVLGAALVRLENELRAAGFDVSRGPGPDHDPRWELEHASGPDTLVTITLRRADGEQAVDLWVLDRLSGKTLIRRVHVPLSEPNAPTVLAVRTTELIRASLLEVTVQQSTPVAPAPVVPSVVTQWMTPPSQYLAGFHVQLGANLDFNDGAGLALLPSIRVGFPSVGPLSIRLFGAATVVASEVERTDGRAQFDEQFAGIEGTVSLLRTKTWVPQASWSVGACHFHVSGLSSSSTFVSAEASAWTAFTQWSLALAYRVSDRLAFVVDLHALLMLPHEQLSIGSQSVGTIGAPSIGLGFHSVFSL